jgi:hypothetical protein
MSSTLVVQNLKNESAPSNNITLDSSGNTTLGGIGKVASLMHPSGAAAAIAMDSSGRVTMPYQPCMVLTGNQQAYASLVTQNGVADTVPFNVVSTGNGAGFNTTTNTFTAPVAGNYLISVWSLVLDSAGNELRIFVNSVMFTRCYNVDRGGCGHSVVVTLSANDYVQLTSSTPIYLNTGDRYSGMSIALIN